MPVIVLEVLKYVFLALVYLFMARAVRAIYLELKPAATGTGYTAPPRQTSRKPAKAPSKAVVVEGSGRGKSFDLKDELIIGRGEKCHLVVDDSYASQVHARIFGKDGSFMVEDLGSTNGTYLNRRRITAPVELQRGDRVAVGKTVLELRK